jgi:hypothetical protein
MSGSIAALFQCLTQGVYVVGVANGEMRDAFTAAWVMQASFDPLLLALSISPRHSSYGLLKEGRAFSINVLKKGQLDLADRYGRPARADTPAPVPIVTTAIDYDPLALGYVKSLAQARGEVTGLNLQQFDLAKKRVELLTQALPSVHTATVFWDTAS